MSDKYNDEYDMSLDLDFEDTEEMEDTYTATQAEPVKPLIEDFDVEETSKGDLYSLQDMMVLMMKAGLSQSNEKGIYPEKIINQIQKTLKENDVKLKMQEADKLKQYMNQFKNAGKESLSKRKKEAVKATMN